MTLVIGKTDQWLKPLSTNNTNTPRLIRGLKPNHPMKLIRQSGLFIFFASLAISLYVLESGSYTLSPKVIEMSISDSSHRALISAALPVGTTYSNAGGIHSAYQATFENINQGFKDKQLWDKVIYSDYSLDIVRNAYSGPVKGNEWFFFFLCFILPCIGGLMYITPLALTTKPGIQHNGIFTDDSIRGNSWQSYTVCAALILFYIVLYKMAWWLTPLVLTLDDFCMAISGNIASRWFMYGLMYCLVMGVMGVRMFIKYRHNRYEMVRTTSVLFFQMVFAFIIPNLMSKLSLPSLDLKNIWPLDYTFFFDYRLDTLAQNGMIGWWLLAWGIALFTIGVPLFTYFYGKRWYCSWVCGCGGLAETLGDPYRQLSDTSTKAWKIERYLIHSVLVFAVLMTGTVLYTYFTGQSKIFGFIDSYAVRETYGFAIGFVFAGAVGTGFYPTMGNRVWCRFGCPLAAYLGIIQRFKSRFRITTNGGQCISCGNCSTYCEMGIDVRAYAQKGENIIRASCVGCGVCSAVCPRGVLKLENINDGDNRFEGYIRPELLERV